MAECSLQSSKSNATNDKKCIPCESLDTSALLTRQQVQDYIDNKTLALWTLQEKSDSNNNILYLSRSFVAKNFQAALDAINSMGAIAEREGHHPDFHLTNYRNVEICLYTHSVGGITQNDVELCQMLDKKVEVVYSPKWLKEHPEAAKKE